jgi:hypothetical protein
LPAEEKYIAPDAVTSFTACVTMAPFVVDRTFAVCPSWNAASS